MIGRGAIGGIALLGMIGLGGYLFGTVAGSDGGDVQTVQAQSGGGQELEPGWQEKAWDEWLAKPRFDQRVAGILVGPSLESARAGAPEEPSSQQAIIVLGRAVLDLVAQQRFAALANRFEATEYTCPIYRVDFSVVGVCEGRSDGDVVRGYFIGRFGSDADIVDERGLATMLRGGYLEFSSAEVQLYTVAETGLDWRDCPDCGAIVLSTPKDSRMQEGQLTTAQVMYFEVFEKGGELRLRSMIVGRLQEHAGEFVMLEGGQLGSQTFIAVGPLAPASGTGLQTPGSGQPTTATLLLAASVVLIAAGGLAFAGSSRLNRRV
jgi:hypothetical protein